MNQTNLQNRLSKAGLLIASLAYAVAICLVYLHIVIPNYAYRGYTIDVDYIALIPLAVVYILVVLFGPNDSSRPSTYIYYFFILLAYFPLLVFCCLSGQVEYSYIVLFSLGLLTTSLVLRLKPGKPTLQLHQKASKNIRVALLCFYFLIAVLSIWTVGGINIELLSFDSLSIYSARREIERSGLLLHYLLPICASSFSAYLLITSIARKEYLLSTSVLITQLLLYLAFAHKTYLLTPLFVLALFVLMRTKKPLVVMTLFFTMLYLLITLFGSFNSMVAGFADRLLSEPFTNQLLFYGFFQHGDYLFMSQNFIGRFFGLTDPYGVPVEYVISLQFKGSSYGMNVGIFADAYAQFGPIGVLGYGLLFGIVLLIVDMSNWAEHNLAATVAVYSALCVSLFDNALLVVLFNGGWIFLMILMLFMRHEDKTNSTQLQDASSYRYAKGESL